MSNKRFLAPILVLAAFGLPAGASVVAYCDTGSPSCTDPSSAFDSTGLLAINFTAASIVSNSFTDPGSSAAFYDYVGGTVEFPTATSIADSENGFQVNLPANTLILAFDYLVPSGSNFAVQVYTSSGRIAYENFTSSSSSTPAFFGVTSDQAITNVYITGSPVLGTISNFDLQGTGGDAQAPEVGTMLMIGIGLISMRWLKRVPLRWFHSHTPHLAS